LNGADDRGVWRGQENRNESSGIETLPFRGRGDVEESGLTLRRNVKTTIARKRELEGVMRGKNDRDGR
jgi:hypothetical protein